MANVFNFLSLICCAYVPPLVCECCSFPIPCTHHTMGEEKCVSCLLSVRVYSMRCDSGANSNLFYFQSRHTKMWNISKNVYKSKQTVWCWIRRFVSSSLIWHIIRMYLCHTVDFTTEWRIGYKQDDTPTIMLLSNQMACVESSVLHDSHPLIADVWILVRGTNQLVWLETHSQYHIDDIMIMTSYYVIYFRSNRSSSFLGGN